MRRKEYVHSVNGEPCQLSGKKRELAIKARVFITKDAYRRRCDLVDSISGKNTLLTGEKLEWARNEKKVITRNAWYHRKKREQKKNSRESITSKPFVSTTSMQIASRKKKDSTEQTSTILDDSHNQSVLEMKDQLSAALNGQSINQIILDMLENSLFNQPTTAEETFQIDHGAHSFFNFSLESQCAMASLDFMGVDSLEGGDEESQYVNDESLYRLSDSFKISHLIK